MTGIAHSINPERSALLPTCLVVLACFCFGTIPYFAKSLTDAGMASYAVAFYRYGLSATVLLPLLLRVPRAQWRIVGWGIVSGASIGLGWIGFVHALKTVPVSTLGVLYMTYPVFTLLIGWVWFRDLPSKRAIIAALMVVNAVVPLFHLGTLEARLTLGAFFFGAFAQMALFARFGFVRLLGVGHILWLPLVVWIWTRAQEAPPGGFRNWLLALAVLNAGSLVIDITDVARYVFGDRDPQVTV